MNHFTTPRFWSCYNLLPEEVRQLADKTFALLKQDFQHPSLHLKRIGTVFSVRVGIRYRALATMADDGSMLWFWIGTHAEYDMLIDRR